MALYPIPVLLLRLYRGIPPRPKYMAVRCIDPLSPDRTASLFFFSTFLPCAWTFFFFHIFAVYLVCFVFSVFRALVVLRLDEQKKVNDLTKLDPGTPP